MKKREPLKVRCEGSGTHPVARNITDRTALCACCGEVVAQDDLGRCEVHDRPDLEAMLHRGDFG
jgi:hypothetical protein